MSTRARLARLRSHVTPATVLSLIALFVALGGSSYAAYSYKVGTNDIADRAVTNAKIANGSVGPGKLMYRAVTNAKIDNDAVGSRKLKYRAVTNSKIANEAVGQRKLKDKAVGTAQLADGAVTGAQVKDGSLEAAALSPAARDALKATDRAAVTKAGEAVAGGTAKAAEHTATGVYSVEFAHDVNACTYAATLAAVKSGDTTDEPAPGFVTVAAGDGATKVVVKTFGTDGTAADAPFHLVVAC